MKNNFSCYLYKSVNEPIAESSFRIGFWFGILYGSVD